jgi:hypothetical protein
LPTRGHGGSAGGVRFGTSLRTDVLFVGMRASERIEVLLALLGRITLPRGSVEAMAPKAERG